VPLTETVYTPPSFQITQTSNVSSGIGWNQQIDYTLHVCNTGAPVPGPVTVTDTHDPSMSVWVFPTETLYGGVAPNFTYTSGNPLIMYYNNGFPGYGACDTITYSLLNTYPQLRY
jgi:hypothetical protein